MTVVKDLGIYDLKTIHNGKGKEGIFGSLTAAIISNNILSFSRNDLANEIALEMATKLQIESSEIKISWHHDHVTLTFVLPSRLAAILFHRHGTGELKKLLEFEIQDLCIGQYDWDNYLDLVPITSG